MPTVRTVDGYAGAMLLERPLPDMVEITVITFWRSVDAIRGFAGDDPEGAVVADQAAAPLWRDATLREAIGRDSRLRAIRGRPGPGSHGKAALNAPHRRQDSALPSRTFK